MLALALALCYLADMAMPIRAGLLLLATSLVLAGCASSQASDTCAKSRARSADSIAVGRLSTWHRSRSRRHHGRDRARAKINKTHIHVIQCSLWRALLCCLIALLCLMAPTVTVAADRLKVIFDTDIDGDNDDVAAAAILHAFADEGRLEILAMGVVSLHPYSPACLDAINTYYGRPDIPIGVYKGTKLAMHGSSYAKIVTERCPNDIGLSDGVPNVMAVYRRVLSKQPDGKVMMIAVGQMNNLVDLLASAPDEYSDLTGRELVRRKVRELFVMAPYFNEKNEYQRAYNFITSPQAAVELIEKWPTTIRFGEGNLGHRHFIGSRLSETPADNPARIAFEAYFAAEKQNTGKIENQRHCADPATVLYAVTGTQYFGEVGPGACDVREDGYTRWNAGRDKQHFYNKQKLPTAELEGVLERLLITPPKRSKE